jgi:NCS1 family nucleobase:cation symporter-1
MSDHRHASAEPAGLGTGVAADDVFSVEQHGMNFIPLADRHGHPRELFGLWAGANLIFTYIIFGAVAMGFGLSFAATLVAMLLGNALFILVGLGGISGPRAGSPTLIVSRAAFGPRGNLPAVVFGWLTIVGFGVVNAVVGTFALKALLGEIGVTAGDGLEAVCLALVLAVTFTAAVWGHATLAVLERWLAYALGIGAVFLLVLVLPKAKLSFQADLAADNTFGAFLLAFFIFASGPFSYLNVPADYTRYLHPGTPSRPIALWATLGGIIPALVMGLIGVAAATATDMSDPVAGLVNLTPGWFTVPFLAIVVGGSITNNILGLYSSGLVLQIIGVPLPRSRTVIIDAVLITAGSLYALFVSDFTTSLTNFLSLMVIWIAPWGGIYLVDIWLRRNRYDVEALHRTDGGRYHYRAGLNPRALAALALGIVAGGAFANSAEFRGPLVGTIGGGDLSVVIGFAVGALAYLVLSRSAAPEPEPAAPAAAEQQLDRAIA